MIAFIPESIIELLPAVFEKSLQQLYLAGISTILAIVVGVPLGVLVSRYPKCSRIALGCINILQTVPSIAMLAFLLPFLGIGVKPALITLSLYAILPIVRNTQTGLQGVSVELLEAADGIGFRPLQKLWMVEIPIALPVIIAGIRTAAVMSVGIATIAAFIGAGGLGDFIFQGISTGNTTLVLVGAIPAALLALLMDLAFGWIETLLSVSKGIANKNRKRRIAVLAAGLVCLVALSLTPFFHTLPWKWGYNSRGVVIASKDFTEQLILGELVAQLLESKSSLTVTRKFNLGTTEICHEAMLRGEVDIYPEYTGTAYLVILKQENTQIPADQLFHYLQKTYRENFNITWYGPLGFENKQTLAITEELSQQLGLETITDLCGAPLPLVIASPPEFLSRSDGYDGLKKGYPIDFKDVKLMAPGLTFPAIQTGQVNVIMAFSTDGRIESYHLVPLKDDKSIFPSYQASLLIRGQTLKTYPEVQSVLSSFIGRITEGDMRHMNYQVEADKQSPASVARTFLKERKLL